MVNNIKFSGEYIFNDNEYTSKNILTKFGKRYLTQYLAGQAVSFEKDIAIGVGSTAATINDTQLEFEFYRSAVKLSSMDITTDPITGDSTYAVVYKATIPVDVSGVIKEIGLFPNKVFGTTDYSSNAISLFTNRQLWTDSSGAYPTTISSPTPNIGTDYTSVTALSSGHKEYFYDLNLDISGYSPNDSFTIAYNQSDLNLDYIYIRTYDSNNNYYEIRYPADNTTGYKIKSLTLNNLYSSGYGSGSPDNTAIVKISVGVQAKSSGSSTVLFDGLRINDEDSFRSDYGLISRSVLATPIIKTFGKQMDIEYRLGLTF
jgi:hypothetical protein